ncbi:MAG: ankyrin repeat domain-containing protein, partial [Rickettsiales bacterium]|nr:ankyrin repeat domain-containing protein [Rickettsiales bacterium]
MLNAARKGDVQAVERIVNSGADINYTDGTGLSIVCTAIMNNDLKAAQILQVYGADASKCDAQIRKYQNKLPKENSGGLFSGLTNAQNMTLAAGGAALVIGGVALLGGEFFGIGGGNGESASGSGAEDGRGTGGGGASTGDGFKSLASIPYSLQEWNTADGKAKDFDLNAAMNLYSGNGAANVTNDFEYMSGGGFQNYLLITGGYASLARGYFGQITPRNSSTNAPLPLSQTYAPISVALITANGVNLTGTAANRTTTHVSPSCIDYSNQQCVNTVQTYKNFVKVNDTLVETTTGYDWSDAGSVFNSAADFVNDSLLAKIIIGGDGEEHDSADFIGYMPKGQLQLYRTGGGKKFKTNLGAVASGFFNAAAETITYTDGSSVQQTISNAVCESD